MLIWLCAQVWAVPVAVQGVIAGTDGAPMTGSATVAVRLFDHASDTSADWSATTKVLSAADLVIGKPGPGVMAEALVRGVPMVTELSAFTMRQERYNAEWLRERDLGVVLDGFVRSHRRSRRSSPRTDFERSWGTPAPTETAASSRRSRRSLS